MSGCLHDIAAALVDGELDHAAREKAHRHLAHCAACRSEVDAQRRLKASVLRLDAPRPSDALTARLLGLAAAVEPPAAGPRTSGPGTAGAGTPGPGTSGAAASGPVTPAADRVAVPSPAPPPVRRAPADPFPARSDAVRPGAVRPATARSGRPGAVLRRPRPAVTLRQTVTLRRGATAGSALAVLGVAAALALGAPPQRPATTPVDPTSDAFVTEFVTTGDGTLRPGPSGPSASPSAGPAPASLLDVDPVPVRASLVDGGVGRTR